jgi:exopolyphosphatase/guanosine-5'-triphosphate,3'-diphosphate pyrophosphatase
MVTNKQKDSEGTKTVAVIDIGSNSLRMEIAEIRSDGTISVLERARLPVRLGQDTFVNHSLSGRSMNAAIAILRNYRKILAAYRVQTIRAVATSAVREASNADTFLDRIFMAVGLEVEVIEPVEECRLIVAAARGALGKKGIGQGRALVVEVGGGSAMLAILQKGEILSTGNYALGSIRLQEALDTAGEQPARAADMLRHQIGSVVKAMESTLPLRPVRTFIALGGDARFVAQQVGTEGNGERLHYVTREDFDALTLACEKHPAEKLAGRYKLPFAEAETLVPALLVYQAILHATRARRLVVSNASMRDGLLLDLARWASGQTPAEEASGAVRAAHTIAEQYHCDMKHAEHVAALALRLFDELPEEHGLSLRHRLILHVAAILHEVGGFISSRSHHKHSYYILSQTPVFGLRAQEQEIVANVARYHRRACPRPTHPPYMSLPRERRVVVSKLAALLRVADALERGHSQQVADFQLERREDEVVLHIGGVTDLALERRALESKGDLFEEAYGLRVRLEEGNLRGRKEKGQWRKT